MSASKPYHRMSAKELLNEYNIAMNTVQLIVNNMAEPMKMAKYVPTKCTGMLKADGFDEAVIGMGNQMPNDPVLIYDADKCIDILMTRDGMSGEEALEFFSYNVQGSYVGEKTPIFIWKSTLEEIE